ncbi:MAG: pyruvate, water dikinase regulatory protein [Coriobacteriia bacterium]|nr:pyruvate, water dikinase regulatory protein [Coriobacteriia bacterium]
MATWMHRGTVRPGMPTIHVVSDGLGTTAEAVARAAASCFADDDPSLETLAEVRDASTMRSDLEEHFAYHQEAHRGMAFVVFHTLVDDSLKAAMGEFAKAHPDAFVEDLMEGPVATLGEACGSKPSFSPNRIHLVNDQYFRRIEAIEFAISHDDGRNPQDLPNADMVIIGVSRASKTPLSIYLSQMGIRVANVPLDPATEPPKELFEVDQSRLFGLMINAETLGGIRKRRLGQALNLASSYADPEHIYQDLESARALMRKLGAIVVHTDNRAVEETAAEILRYYGIAHPQYRRMDP